MGTYRKFGFGSEQQARRFLYDMWRNFDLDVRNADRSPQDTPLGTRERWAFPAGYFAWRLTTPKVDRGFQADGITQHAAIVEFESASQAPPHLWTQLVEKARGHGGTPIS
jgi:hypothetical protein